MSQDAFGLTLPRGLAAQTSANLARLVADITGQPDSLDALPYLAPALLFEDQAAQQRLAFPQGDSGTILVQEYQGINYDGPFPQNESMTVRASTNHRGGAVEYDFVLSSSPGYDCARLKTALRVLPTAEFTALKPTHFRKEVLDQTTQSREIAISQDAVDRYLVLSGDRNPIHTAQGATQYAGLTRPVVPGLLLVSLIQPYCQIAQPGLHLISLKTRFLAPLFVAQPLWVALQQRGTDSKTGNARMRAYLLGSGGQAMAITDLVFGDPPESGAAEPV